RSGATNRGGGAAAGSLAGVAFALAASMLALLARISLSFGGPATGLAGGRFTTAIGPDLLSGPLVALAWGVIGGAIGGGLVWRPRPVAAAGPSDATPVASQGAQPDPGARPGDQ